MLSVVEFILLLCKLFLHSLLLSCASCQLSSQLALLLSQLDVVRTQPVEALLQLLQNNRSHSIIICVFYSSEHVKLKDNI